MLVAKLTGNENEAELTWKSVANSASYDVQMKNGAPDAAYVMVGSSTRGKFTMPNLTPGAQYTFRVRALGSAGPGSWSNPVTIKVL